MNHDARSPQQTEPRKEIRPPEAVDAAAWDPSAGPPMRIAVKRHYGRWFAAVVVIGLAAGWIVVMARAPIDYGLIPQYMFDGQVLQGVALTLELTLAAMALGIVLGFVSAVMRASPNPVASWAATLYIGFFRGTPQLVQLLIFFNLAFIAPRLGVPGVAEVDTNHVMTPFIAALLALGINEGAYMSEIFRSGLLAVDRGQTEAATALGMRRSTMMRYIILPQALRVIVPPAGNQLIAMLKVTSLAYVISVSEVLGTVSKIYTSNFKIIELLFVASIWYLVLTTVLSLGQRVLERRLNRGHAARDAEPGRPRRRLVRNERLAEGG